MTRDFLSRWSRLKSEADKAAPDEPDLRVADPASPEARLAGETRIEAFPAAAEAGPELPTEADAELTADEIARLSPIEDLVSASDLAPFLRSGVPTLLRNAALRRMWTINPAIRDYVGDACEYAYDWNVPGGAPGCGPMLPSDDVKAMVRRIFDGPPPPDERKIEDGATDAPAATGPAGEPLGVEDTDRADCEETTAGSSAAGPAGKTEAAEAPTSHSLNTDSLSAGLPAGGAPRGRRHGGATPA